MTRRVVLVCGPPGSGKTTYAQDLGLDVYDADEPQWTRVTFNAALDRLGHTPEAQAVVIRSAPTASGRDKIRLTIGATETVILDVPAEECIRRIHQRGQHTQPVRHQIRAVRDWWEKYEPDPAQSIEPIHPSENW